MRVSGLNFALVLGMLFGFPIALLLAVLIGGGSTFLAGLAFLIGCGISWLGVRSRIVEILLQPQIAYAESDVDLSALQEGKALRSTLAVANNPRL